MEKPRLYINSVKLTTFRQQRLIFIENTKGTFGGKQQNLKEAMNLLFENYEQELLNPQIRREQCVEIIRAKVVLKVMPSIHFLGNYISYKELYKEMLFGRANSQL